MTAASNNTDKIITGLLGAGVALVPLIANTVIGAIQGRSARSRRDNAIAAAKSRVDFLNGWIKAQEDIAPPERLAELKESATHELDDIRQSVLSAVAESAPKPLQIADRHVLQNLFLLYRPRSVGGWVTHALFYMSAGALIAWLGYFYYSDVLIQEYSLVDDLSLIIGVAIPVLILAIVMQIVARAIDNRVDETIRASQARQ